MRMLRAELEQFWPSRRVHAFDEMCTGAARRRMA